MGCIAAEEPNENGAFRNSGDIRGNRLISTVDIYQFSERRPIIGISHFRDNDLIIRAA